MVACKPEPPEFYTAYLDCLGHNLRIEVWSASLLSLPNSFESLNSSLPCRTHDNAQTAIKQWHSPRGHSGHHRAQQYYGLPC